MNSLPLTLKNPRGWFAAGAEVERAMSVLSDGAFKLFIYICLNARRDTGILEISQTELARNVKKGKQTIRRHLGELQDAGVCQAQYTNSPQNPGRLEIAEAYWPYCRSAVEDVAADGSSVFVAAIKKMLSARACIRAALSTADEILAREWFDRGITLELIQQAILMGCIRRYVSWRNTQNRTPIGSLRYFQSVVEELQQQTINPEYWGYLRHRMERMEKAWKESAAKETDSASEQ